MVEDVEPFLPAVPDAVDEGDRHVVAAALAARADGIVTRNIRHFPVEPLEALGIEVQALDEFLVNQWTLDAKQSPTCSRPWKRTAAAAS